VDHLVGVMRTTAVGSIVTGIKATGGQVGLLFQPRWTNSRPRAALPAASDAPIDRGVVFTSALDGLLRGDASRFGDLFTDDVVVSSPHLVVESLRAVQRALGSPEDSLSQVQLCVARLDAVGERLIGEWCLEGTFASAIMWDDSLLIEPTNGDVRLLGASFAEFRGHQIRRFRHYFDDSELLTGVPSAPSHLRWRSGS